MTQVHTDFGPGEIIASETVRGRTQHKVAIHGVGEIWVDEAKLGGTRVADAFAWQPPADSSYPHPGHSGEFEDPDYANYRDNQYYPEDEQSHWEQDPAYQEHMFGGDWGPDTDLGSNPHGTGGPYNPQHPDWYKDAQTRQAWAPVDHDNSVNLPYDPTPQYPAIPGDTESTLQPIHEIDADERLSPADSITFEDRATDEGDDHGQPAPNPDLFEKAAGFHDFSDPDFGVPEDHEVSPYTGETHGPTTSYGDGSGYHWRAPGGEGFDPGAPTPHQRLEWDAPERREYAHPDFQDEDYDAGPTHFSQQPSFQTDQGYFHDDVPVRGPRMGSSDIPGHMSNVHEAFAFLIPLAEGLAGAGAGSAAAGAAGEAGMGALGQGVARGVGSAATHEMMGGGDPSQGGGGDPIDQVLDATAPGPGWGELQRGAALNQWLASREDRSESIGAGLSDKYIDITASADYHNDPVAQFRHDPIAYIQRVGHVHDEPVSADMEHYGNLVEANASIREAAWKDVRAKAMRLRREGRVAVKDVSPDRIYATVEGDHGTYDVMIAKGGAFGGFGGGHSISNWRCACEWGKWAFQRRLTYVGRLCSHGYAAYMEMQSQHTKGKERLPRQHRYRKADALQNEPQRLVPELVVNSEDDARIFLDVTKDEREDVGPDDIVSEQDIVHFARVMEACEREQLPYPRELVAFLERLAEDQTEEDWKVEDAGEAAGAALNEIRDWADTPQAEDFGNMEQRNEEIRDAVDQARDGGTDASALVAFRTAAPQDEASIFGGDYTPVRDAPSAPSGSREPGGDTVFPQVDSGRQGPPRDPFGRQVQTEPGGGAGIDRTGPGLGGADAAPASGSMFGPALGPGEAPDAPLGIGNAGAGAPATPGTAGSPMAGGGAGAQGVSPATPGAGATGGGATGSPGYFGQPAGGGGNSIGQGNYQVQSGDTLSDIAQRAGYGGDYNSLAQQNNIADPNHIETGQSINIGKPGGGSQGGSDSGSSTPRASDSPSTNAEGGPVNQNSGGKGADEGSGAATPPASNPAQTGSNPATPSTGAPSTTNVDTSAIPGGSSSGGATDTSVANSGAGSASTDTPSTSDTGGGGGGTQDSSTGSSSGQNTADAMSNAGDVMSGISNAVSSVRGLFGSVYASQGDYEEWQKFAYPEIGPGSHQPFAGSGPLPSLEFSTSEEYADKARKNHDDVTDLENHNVEEPQARTSIRRAGKGPRRTVVPQVVRQQKVQNGRVVEAEHALDDFDPYSRTAASFEDPYKEASADAVAQQTASSGRDFVAEFQRGAGAAILSSNGPSGGGDSFDIAGAASQFLQRTAGRNYSLAEQAELIREGDIGGAGNADLLDLKGTHYEAMNSVGLW